MYLQQYDFKPEEILIYLRKSRSDDPSLTVEEVLSRHETILDEWCTNNIGAVVPEVNKFREVVSGETIDDRPEIQKVLKLIESPKYKAILTVEVQRLSRGDLEDAGRLIKLLRYTHTYVFTQHYNYDLRDEHDRENFERELKRGNEFLEYQKKIMNRGRLLSVQQGNFIGSIPPYGFNKVWIEEGKRKCPILEENKEEADVVRMIFDMYVNQDMGRTNICHKLDDLGIKPPKGKYWSPPALKDLLENVHYIGKVRWNWRKTITIVEDSEIIQTRPKSKIDEYMVCEGKHDGIISEELFMKAREKQGKNYRAKPKTKIRNPLQGLLYCECGKAMSYRVYKNKGVVKSAPRFLCNNQIHCGNSSCLFDEMIDYLCNVLEDCIKDFEFRIKNNEGNSVKLHNNLVKNLEKRLEDLNKKELSQWDKYTEEGMPKHIFDNLNAKVLKEKEEVELALCKAKDSMPDPVNYEEKLSKFKNALEALQNPDIDVVKKNKLLKDCFERITYKREKAVRITKEMAGGKGKLERGGAWTSPPMQIEVKLHL